ncbi:hypothetical protein SERLA73DRAFT_124167 [Serpula lacrymans var. lacrymans S7.3]|uniref:Fungal-type protein kinase domain-containing protein n=2 Tax=Serpula lacrymans var. lacrymans TaxID=341189 RepID=F8Q2R0_SERL3|nr:hypothetical protein SERLA73DRAFT_124167 [Serpula lacrymans var. lacrymans S7.3]
MTVLTRTHSSLTKPPPLSYHHIGNDDPITTARKAFLTSTPKERPSNTGTPSTFRTRQHDPQRLKSMPCGRPREYEETIPVTLLHPVFGQFLDDCQTIDVTAEDNSFIEHLATAITNGLKLLTWYFKTTASTLPSTKPAEYLTNAEMKVNGHRYVIAEFKNETGSTSTEPYFQAIGYYLDSTREYALKFSRSPLPCLLLTIFGPYMVFAGAAWNLRPTVQILSTPIAFHFHSTDIHNRLTVARHMAAFRKAAERLNEYYENLTETPVLTSAPVPPHMFAYPTSYISLHSNTLKHFWYVIELDSDKLVFSGTEDEGDHICIKFVQTYSCDVHNHFASLGCAPALRGFEKIAGGWFMVVMDMLPDDFEMLSARTGRLPLSVFTDISAKLESLHEAGYVHGDIRDTNIMVSKTDKTRFMIIDFDWAGSIEEARYPACVNYMDIVRPQEARDGKKILRDHDNFMLQVVKRWNFMD